jgi:hypothetical protein
VEIKNELHNLFEIICKLAKENDKEGLQGLLDSKSITIDIEESYHTPASLLACQGEHQAVIFLETEFGSNPAASAYGYARAKNHSYVQKYEKLKHNAEKMDEIINLIAFGYAFAGEHEYVEYYKQLGADEDYIKEGYRLGGFTNEKNTNNNNESQKKDFCEEHIEDFIIYRQNYETSKNTNNHNKYKLRINLDDSTFSSVNKRNCIIKILKELITKYPNSVTHFKHFTITGVDINEKSQIYQNTSAVRERLFWEAIRDGRLDDAKNIYYPSGEEGSNERRTYYDRKNIAAGLIKLSGETIEKELKIAENGIKSIERFNGSAQFTLYLSKEYDQQALTNFTKELEDKLQKIEVKPGKVTPPDLPLTDFISMRLEELDNIYIAVAKATEAQIAQLETELKKSPTYKKLYKNITQPKFKDSLTIINFSKKNKKGKRLYSSNSDGLKLNPSKINAKQLEKGCIQLINGENPRQDNSVELSGKWIIEFDKNDPNLDKAWKVIINEMENGDVFEAEVYGFDNNRKKQAIIIYSPDFRNLDEISKIKNNLILKFKQKGILCYKFLEYKRNITTIIESNFENLINQINEEINKISTMGITRINQIKKLLIIKSKKQTLTKQEGEAIIASLTEQITKYQTENQILFENEDLGIKEILSIADEFKERWEKKLLDKDFLYNLTTRLSNDEKAEFLEFIGNDLTDESLHELVGYLLNMEDVDTFLRTSTFTKKLLILEAERAGFAKYRDDQLISDEGLLGNLHIPPFLIDHSINLLHKFVLKFQADKNISDNARISSNEDFKKDFVNTFIFNIMNPIIIDQLNILGVSNDIMLHKLKSIDRNEDEFIQNYNRIYILLTLTENNLTADESPEGLKKLIEFKFTQFENELNAVSQLSITRKHKQNLNALKESLLEEINDKHYDNSKKPKITDTIEQTEHLVSEYKKTIMELTDTNDKSIRKQKVEFFISKSKEYENNLINYSLGQKVFTRACTFVGGLIGAVIGLAAGIFLGGVVCATTTSVFPGIGTVAGVIAGSIGSIAFTIKGAGLGAATGEAAAAFILGLPSSFGAFKGCQKVPLFFNAHQRCTKDLSHELSNSINENLKKP